MNQFTNCMPLHYMVLRIGDNSENFITMAVWRGYLMCNSQVQSTLVISKSKGPSETVRDIRTPTYQICSIEEKTI